MHKKNSQTFIIPDHHANERLDQVLAKLMPAYSRTQIQEWITAGGVLVNNHPAKAKLKVKGGEEVTVDIITKAQPAWEAWFVRLLSKYGNF